MRSSAMPIVAAGRLDVLAHPGGAADEDVIDACRRHQRAQQHAHFLAVEPAVQDRNILLFARNDMEQRQPLHEAVFQFLERFEEQHVRCRAVAVKQKEAAVWFARQHALDDRQDRRDAASGGKADIGPRLAGRMGNAEAAGRRHHVELVAGLQFVGGPVRERAAVDLFHGDTQLAVVGPRADRIGTAHFLAVHRRAQGEVLPRREAVIVFQLLRDRKRHRYSVSGFAAQVADGETVKARCVGHGQ